VSAAVKQVDLVFGTRPEAIKMLPLALALREPSSGLSCRIIVTAQHRDMLDQVMRVFDVESDLDLDIMLPGQSLTDITTRGLVSLETVFRDGAPNLVLVHGDTTTTLAATLAAFYQKIPVGHVEAGLRSGNNLNPWPEEVNRRVADAICELHFAPTATSRDNLLRENISPESVFVTGNTGIDGLQLAIDNFSCEGGLANIKGCERLQSKRFVLVTAHRRENFGQPIVNLCRAILDSVTRFPELEFVYPVHPNPAIDGPVREILGGVQNVHLLAPLDYGEFVTLMNASWFVLTDSGGIQEEAPALGKPVLVFRQVTERPEAVDAGTVKIIGTEQQRIADWIATLCKDEATFAAMQRAINPYGDGKASARIVAAIRHYFGMDSARPDEFVPH
jgi:UDP-N-acetylglucosamine 2-epimerase (non-hydrolysing)